MLTRDEIIWGYRFILGRDPESEETIRAHAFWSDIDEFRAALLRSEEFDNGGGLGGERKTVAARESYLVRNASYWSQCEPRTTGDGAILVDLMHDNTEYLLRCLVIARFLRQITGAPLLGILGTPGVVPKSCPNYDAEANRELAQSFGVSRFEQVSELKLPRAGAVHPADELKSMVLSHGQTGMFPPALVDWFGSVVCDDGHRLGRSIQQTFMRSNLVPSLRADARLLSTIDEVASFHEWATALVAAEQPIAFVTGHFDYTPWGHLADVVANRGGRIAYFRLDPRMQIHLLLGIPVSMSFHGRARVANARAFKHFLAKAGSSKDHEASRLFTLLDNGYMRHWTWLPPNSRSGSDAHIEKRDGRPLYCLFAHALTDQPATDDALFCDHLQWISETLAHSSKQTTYDLVVKMHPHGSEYDATGAIEALRLEYADATNIAFAGAELDDNWIAENCTAGITVRGTPGLLMSARGLPMILAGRSLYSDAGFCAEPATKEAYFELLQRGETGLVPETISRLARLYLAFDRIWAAPLSNFIPAFRAMACDAGFWDSLSARLDQAYLESDPTYVALAQAWLAGEQKVMG